MSSSRSRATIEYLAERAQQAGGITFGDETRSVGISSNAMVRHAIGGAFPTPWEYPADESDHDACLRALAMAPEHLHEAMLECLAAYAEVPSDG